MKKNASIGEFLKERRMKKGITQADLSKTLGYSSAQFISNIERDTARPPLKILRTLMRVLEIGDKEMYDLILTHSEMVLRKTIFGSKAARR